MRVILDLIFHCASSHAARAGNRAGPGQNLIGLKFVRFFRAKILIAQPVLKTRPIGPNSTFKVKKNSGGSGRVILDQTKFDPIFFGAII